jgi:hypothetical protein
MVRATAIAVLILVTNMVFNTPSVRAATLAEMRPAAATCPAAKKAAALIVEDTTEGGTQAEAAF